MAKKRHHYVPAFLLGRFASPVERSGSLCALDKATGRPRQSSPNNVAVEKDYNTFAGVPEVDPLLPEEVYEKIESDGAPLIRRLGQRSLFLDDHERAALALFVSSLSLRVRRVKRNDWREVANSREMGLALRAAALIGVVFLVED